MWGIGRRKPGMFLRRNQKIDTVHVCSIFGRTIWRPPRAPAKMAVTLSVAHRDRAVRKWRLGQVTHGAFTPSKLHCMHQNWVQYSQVVSRGAKKKKDLTIKKWAFDSWQKSFQQQLLRNRIRLHQGFVSIWSTCAISSIHFSHPPIHPLPYGGWAVFEDSCMNLSTRFGFYFDWQMVCDTDSSHRDYAWTLAEQPFLKHRALCSRMGAGCHWCGHYGSANFAMGVPLSEGHFLSGLCLILHWWLWTKPSPIGCMYCTTYSIGLVIGKDSLFV